MSHSKRASAARVALRQVIADCFFSMAAGETWQQGGYKQPEPNGGDDALAADIIAAGWLSPEQVRAATQKAWDEGANAVEVFGGEPFATANPYRVPLDG